MSEFKHEARYIVVKPDCEDSLRTERLKSYIDEMCFKTPDCVVVEADWPEYEPVWRMIESRVMGLPNELEYAQSELAALREELAMANGCLEEWRRSKLGTTLLENTDLQQRLADAERRYRGLQKLTPYKFRKIQDASTTDGIDILYFHADRFDALLDAALTKPEEAKS